jgi:hypothetical protein
MVGEALDNRSPVEAVPCTNWELRTLTGAAEGLPRVCSGLTKSPVEAGDQGACPSADPSSLMPSQDGPRSSAPFAGPQLDLEAALRVCLAGRPTCD